MPTPDPSAVPLAVWVTGLAGDGFDYARLAIVAVVVGLAVVSVGVWTLAALVAVRR